MSGSVGYALGRSVFFFNDTATTEIYTLSLHDALPIFEWYNEQVGGFDIASMQVNFENLSYDEAAPALRLRSEEHTSELQSQAYLVCRLLLEKKK